MRRFKIATIAFLVCMGICLCAILSYALIMKPGEWGESRAFYSLVQEVQIEAGEIRSLEIDYGGGPNDVYFYEGTGDTILIREYMNYTPKENQVSAIRQDGERLVIKGRKKKLFSFFLFRSRDAYTEIYLPAGFAETLRNMEVKTVSGGIRSEVPFTLEENFRVSSTSGDIFFPQIQAGKIGAQSTSGNIGLEDVTAPEITASTTSGDIALGQGRGDARLSSTSGKLALTKLEGDLRASTTSGDIILGEIDGGMNLSSTSGDIRLECGRGELDAETVSGDIRAEALEGFFEFDTTSGTISVLGGEGGGKADSVSGDIRIFLELAAGDFNVSTTSGNVDFKLPDTEGYSLNFDSTSGECRTFFDGDLSFSKKGNRADGKYGDGARVIRVSTVSGDLRITEWKAASSE